MRDLNSVQRLRVVAARGLLWLSGEQISRRAIDHVFTIILARLLLPKDFGIIALASVFTSLLRNFADLGLGASIVQRREIDDEYLSTAFWANLAAGVALTGSSAILAVLLSGIFQEPETRLVLVLLSFRFVITAWSSTQYAVVSRRMDYRALTIRNVAASVAGGLIGIVLAYQRAGVWSLVGQALGSTIISTILIYHAVPWRPKREFSWAKFADLWAFGGPLQLSRLFNNLVRQSDNFLIGRYLGSTALGFYSLAYTVYLIPINDIGLLNTVLFSGFSRLQGDSERLKRGFVLATRYATVLGLPVMVGLSLVAPVLVSTFFGEKWLPSAPIMSILALAGFLQLLTSFGPTGLVALGRADLRLQFSILSVLVYLPAYGVGLRWGTTGVAAGYLVATAVLTPILYGFVARVLNVSVRDLWEAVYPAVLGSVLMAAVVWPVAWAAVEVLRLPSIIVLTLLVGLGASVYGGAVWLIQRDVLLGLIRILREALPKSENRPPTRARET